MAIITTSENIERLKEVVRKNGIDKTKIVTHQQFLDLCKQKYSTYKKK